MAVPWGFPCSLVVKAHLFKLLPGDQHLAGLGAGGGADYTTAGHFVNQPSGTA